MNLAGALAEAVAGFLGGLSPPVAASARLPFDDEVRRAWAYWPATRPGVALAGLDRGQVKAAHRLLATLVSLPAYARAVTIMNLDEVLDRLEGYRSDRRHGLDYWIAVFGAPGDDRWGVRFEGHHVSVHATVGGGGEVWMTPLFLGANPAVVEDGGLPAVAPLGPEERLGFELLHGLSTEQRAAALVAERAPDDIASRNLPRIGWSGPAPGVPLAALTGSAASTANALVDLYLARVPAGARRPDPSGATFAWAGAAEPGRGHYYRICGPRLLVELDNTQDAANHVHTVLRDPGADFGDDLLSAHHRHAHPKG